jgi:hypothetical protein
MKLLPLLSFACCSLVMALALNGAVIRGISPSRGAERRISAYPPDFFRTVRDFGDLFDECPNCGRMHGFHIGMYKCQCPHVTSGFRGDLPSQALKPQELRSPIQEFFDSQGSVEPSIEPFIAQACDYNCMALRLSTRPAQLGQGKKCTETMPRAASWL